MDYERRGGRGDRMGRYGSSCNDHNFRDMDYRAYSQEDEEAGPVYDNRDQGNRQYRREDQPGVTCDFPPGRLQDHPGFSQRGEVGREAPGQCRARAPAPRVDPAFPGLQRDEDGPGRREEQFRTGERARGQGARGFPNNGAHAHLRNRDSNWAGEAMASQEQSEYNAAARPREEERFPRGTANTTSFPGGSEERGGGILDLSFEEFDQRDQDYRADMDQNQMPSNIVMLRMLPPDATANEIRAQLLEQGIQPREVRLMRNKCSGQSRGFAFVEFNLIQEASRWMETNQMVLSILGQRVAMHYSDPKPRANEDWLCSKCGVQNFKRREKCFKCSVHKSEAELKLPLLQREVTLGLQKEGSQGLLPLPVPYHSTASSVSSVHAAQQQQQQHYQQQPDVANDTLIVRNLGPHTPVEAILMALAPFATLSPSNVRLIKDKHTHLNRGFAFLQLTTIVEASQLLQILQALQPTLSIEGKAIDVEFAKGSKRDVFLTDSSRVSNTTVASTAIAAAQWAVTQTVQNGSGGGQGVDAAMYQQGAAVAYNLDGQDYPVGEAPQAPQVTPGSASGSAGAGLMGAYTGRAAPVVSCDSRPSAMEAAQPPIAHSQPTLLAVAEQAQASQQVEIVGKPQPAAPSPPATPGTDHELQQYPVPDVSTYQYDESSGFYYDPLTGLYYDPNSQYYFNSHSQQYMYWEGEKQTYVAAQADGDQTTAPGDASGPSEALTAPGGKERKDKPKSKTAQQIAKDMERWAKSLNRQKENVRSSSSLSSSSSSPTVGSAALAFPRPPGHARLDERREAASADAGYAVLEKKGALSERPQIFLEQIRHTAELSPPQQQQQQGLVPAYSGETDSDEEGGEREDKDGRMTDWSKLACLLCRRQFPSKEALIRHQQLSELHKQNLEKRKIQQDAAGKERQVIADRPEPPDAKRRKFSPVAGVTGTSLGARMLQGGMKRGLILRNMHTE